MHTRRLGAAGAVVVLAVGAFFFSACDGSPRDKGRWKIGRPAWHLENLELSGREDPQQLHHFAVSDSVEIEPLGAAGLELTWAHGRGLTAEAVGPESYVDLGAPLTLSDPTNPDLLFEISAATAMNVDVRWTDRRCPTFRKECSYRLAVRPEREQRIRAPLGSLRSGAVDSMRLRFQAGARATIHQVRTVPRADPDGLIVSDAENPTPPTYSHHSRVEILPGRGLRVVPVADAGSPLDVHLAHAVDLDARDAPVFVLDAPQSGVKSIQVFWTGEACPSPDFSPDCSLRSEEASPGGRWIFQMGTHLRWRGRIDQFRVDLDGTRQPTLLTRMRFVGSEDGAAGTGNRLGRSPRGGPRFLVLQAGQRVVFDLPAEDEASDFALDDLEFRVPASRTYIQLFELRGYWIDEAGSRREAVYHTGSFASEHGSGWSRLRLDKPDVRPSKLVLELTCGPNCDRFDQPGRYIAIARPLYRFRDGDSPPPAKNLLVVMIDTLRADHLPVYGYPRPTSPFIEELAGRSTVYDAVFSVDTWTSPAHAALFTGQYPYYAGSRHFLDLDVKGATLAEALASRGYQTIALTDGGVLAAGQGLDRGFDLWDVTYQPIHLRFQRALELIETAHESGRPLFTFIHSYAVHEPYSLGRRNAERLEPEFSTAAGLPVDSHSLPALSRRLENHTHVARFVEYLEQRYDAGIRAFDAELEAFLRRLGAKGVLGDTVVAIMSDHGEELYEHGNVGHGFQLPYRELTHVPLIIHDPDETRADRVARPTSQTEIAGILLEALGLHTLPRDPCRVAGLPFSFVTTRHFREHPTEEYLSVVVTSATCQYLEVSERGTGDIVVSDLATGDATTCDVDLPQMREVLECVKSEMRRHHGYGAPAHDQAPAGAPRALSEAERQQLEALGYVVE